MNFTLVTEYSPWLIVVCILFASLVCFFLYRKYKQFTELKKWQKYWMYISRFLFVFFLSFLLLSPLIKHLSKNIEDPIIIVVQDNSESILLNKDSMFYKTEYAERLNTLINQLDKKYTVVNYSFGSEVQDTIGYNFNEKLTDYQKIFDEIEINFSNRNIGAVVFSSDGIFNTGFSPLNRIKSTKYPVYTIALGDTAQQKDIILSDVIYNKIAFLGNSFPVKVQVDINQLKGIATRLNVYHENQNVFSKEIRSSTENYAEEVLFEIEANKSGIQYYTLSLSSIEDEISLKNNSMRIAIDVIDGKQKILILSNSPHPDVSAIYNALLSNLNFQVDKFVIDDFNGNISDYNAVLMHQLPSRKNTVTDILKNVMTNKIPVLFVMGSQTDIVKINALNVGISIKQRKTSFEESTPVLNKDFSLFQVNDTKDLYTIATPLITPFGDYSTGVNTYTLLSQKIRSIETAKPLIAFYKVGNHKIGYITGEGIWRWRIYDNLYNGTKENFNELMNKLIQFLALKVNKQKFIVNAKNIYNETESIIIDAEIYDDNFELNNEADINLDIFNENQKKFSYLFNREGNAYRLNAGTFPVGKYTYKASVKIDGKQLSERGAFTVVEMNLEAKNTIANHKLLNNIARYSQGEMFFPDKLEDVYQKITNNENIIPVSYAEKDLIEIINIKWIFFILLFLIAMEWFLRKYFGSY